MGLLLFVFGYSFLKGQSLLKSQKILYTIYPEIEGLIPGAKITLNGLSIGSVIKADFLPGTTDILISMNIRGDINFSKYSEAVLYETGLIGGKAISIVPKFDSDKPVISGDTLVSLIKPGFTELVNRQIAPLQEKIESTLTSVDSLFIGVSNVLNVDTQNNLKNTLKNLSISLENINNAMIKSIVKSNKLSINNSIENINNISSDLSSISSTIKSSDLELTLNNLKSSSDNLSIVLDNINNGNGSLSKLISNDSLFNNLNDASKSIDLLLEDIRLNPKRYIHFSVFGKKNKAFQSNKN